MIVIKNKQALAKMRVAGEKLSRVMESVKPLIVPGVSTLEIDSFLEKGLREKGLHPVCKGYGSYKHASCISVNDAVVHGIPSDEIILQDGDCVSVDLVGSYKGYCADMARTFLVGAKSSDRVERLIEAAQVALDVGLSLVKPGVHLSDVSAAIQKEVESRGFGVIRDFVGHGIGKDLHEDPQVPNFGKSGKGPILREGMTLAIEPMITEKKYKVSVQPDGWTVKTVDGGWAAHVEDTIVVLADGCGILTRFDDNDVKGNV